MRFHANPKMIQCKPKKWIRIRIRRDGIRIRGAADAAAATVASAAIGAISAAGTIAAGATLTDATAATGAICAAGTRRCVAAGAASANDLKSDRL